MTNTQILTPPCTTSKIKSQKELFNSFHLKGQTLGFHPHTQKVEPPCTACKTVPHESTAQWINRFRLYDQTLRSVIHRLKSYNQLATHNKQYHMQVLLKSFHLNGHILGFHPLSCVYYAAQGGWNSIQMKAIERYFPVVLFIILCKVVLAFESG